jgi:hypothetical protein
VGNIEAFREKAVEVGKTASLVVAAAGVLLESAPVLFFGAFGYFVSNSLKTSHA